MARRSTRPLLIGVPLVFLAWAATAVAATFLQPAGRPVAVVAGGGLYAALAAVVAADGSILQIRGDTVIAVSDDPGFVAHLYRAGALLVVPGSPGGCSFAANTGTGA